MSVSQLVCSLRRQATTLLKHSVPRRTFAITARPDYKRIAENPEYFDTVAKQRQVVCDPYLVQALHQQRTALVTQIQEVREARNQVAKAVKREQDGDKRQILIQQGSDLKTQLEALEEHSRDVEEQLLRSALLVPNDVHPAVPIGGEDANQEVGRYGWQEGVSDEERIHADAWRRDHLDLNESLHFADFGAAAQTTGSKFVFLRAGGAMLELALTQWAMGSMITRGFTPVIPPDLIRPNIVEGCGFSPRGEHSQIYHVQDNPLCLAATSEISLAGLHANTIIPTEALPLRYAAVSHCFRHEAGGAGSASRGLYRLHQFSKIEMFGLCGEEKSDALLQEFLDVQIQLYQELGLPFRVLNMATEELGAPAYRKYDLEAWMPGRKDAPWGEITSTSNCTDFQARRLNIRHKPSTGGPEARKSKPSFVHTVNGTACAVPRTILAIVENYQLRDGSVEIPEVLHPYMHGITKLDPQ